MFSIFLFFLQNKRLKFFIIDVVQNANTYKIRRKSAANRCFSGLILSILLSNQSECSCLAPISPSARKRPAAVGGARLRK